MGLNKHTNALETQLDIDPVGPDRVRLVGGLCQENKIIKKGSSAALSKANTVH